MRFFVGSYSGSLSCLPQYSALVYSTLLSARCRHGSIGQERDTVTLSRFCEHSHRLPHNQYGHHAGLSTIFNQFLGEQTTENCLPKIEALQKPDSHPPWLQY